MRFDAPLFAFQLERVELGAQRLGFGTERRRTRGSTGLGAFELSRLDRNAGAFLAPRRAGAQVREDLEVADARGDAAKPARAPHLCFELGDAPFELGDQIVDANPVLLGRVQPAHRLALASQELADAGGFLEERAPFGRLEERMASIWPCETIAYDPAQAVPISSSTTSRKRRRTIGKNSDSPAR